MSFYVSTATFFLLHCDEWDRVVALPRHKFVTGATLLQLLHHLCVLHETNYMYFINQSMVVLSCLFRLYVLCDVLAIMVMAAML